MLKDCRLYPKTMGYHWNEFKQYNQIYILGRPLSGITSTYTKTYFQTLVIMIILIIINHPTWKTGWTVLRNQVLFLPHTIYKTGTHIKDLNMKYKYITRRRQRITFPWDGKKFIRLGKNHINQKEEGSDSKHLRRKKDNGHKN